MFRSYWYGEELTPSAIMCMNSFLTHGFVYELYSYDVPRLVPQRVVLRPAETIVQAPENMASGTDPSRFSNWFRYNLLDRLGGWWVDTDVVCNTASIPAAEIASAVEDRHGTVAAGTLKFPVGHAAVRELLARYADADRDPSWGTVGPKLVTQVLSGAEFDPYLWKRQDVYPIHWVESWKLLLPEFRDELRDRTKQSVFVHLYTSMWRRNFFRFDEREVMPLGGSFLRDLYDEYGCGVTLPELQRTEEAALRRSIDEFLALEWVKEVLTTELIPASRVS